MAMTREQVAALLDGTTPGPWRWTDHYPTTDGRETWSLLGDKHGYGILSCDGEPNSPQGLADWDNARLIAAAPDLARLCLSLMDRLADADMAQAALVELAADSLLECSVWCDSQERTDEGWRNGVNDARKHHMAAIRALAPDVGVKDLAALRARVQALSQQVDTISAHRDELDFLLHEGGEDSVANLIADNTRLAAELAEARKQVEAGDLTTAFAALDFAKWACNAPSLHEVQQKAHQLLGKKND